MEQNRFKFRLVRPDKQHEQQAMDYLKEFYADRSETHGIGGLERFRDDYDGWLKKLESDRHLKPTNARVPAETFFLMKTPVDGTSDTERLVGTVNIRLVLNDNLWKFGGNIGYSIRPSERRKGYNKINLFLALKACQAYGIEAVLLDCDKDNLGSSRTMRALGGCLLREHWVETKPDQKSLVQIYVIDVANAIAQHEPEYAPFISEYPTKV